MGVFPVAMSLLASFISAIMILSSTAEVNTVQSRVLNSVNIVLFVSTVAKAKIDQYKI